VRHAIGPPPDAATADTHVVPFASMRARPLVRPVAPFRREEILPALSGVMRVDEDRRVDAWPLVRRAKTRFAAEPPASTLSRSRRSRLYPKPVSVGRVAGIRYEEVSRWSTTSAPSAPFRGPRGARRAAHPMRRCERSDP
jgi:hypothetical protein